MVAWDIREDDDEEYPQNKEGTGEEVSEISEEESSEEAEPLEDMLGTPSSSTLRSRFNRQGESSPVLEAEPVDDLETGVRQAAAQTEDREKTKEPEIPVLYNAPQYSGSYESGEYARMRKADTEMDISAGALITRETPMIQDFQRRMDFGAWQQQNVDRADTQGEKYQVGKPEHFKQQDDLPFQDQKKQRRF